MPASQRYFALFGARRTGKTAYLASLYATSGDAGDGGPAYHVSASDDLDDPTHPYLGRIGRALKAGQWPDSSPPSSCLTGKLKIRFTLGDLTRSLVLPDVGGELTIRDQQGQLDLKKEILAHYQDYHGFLIFIPADLTDPERAAESKWEVDALLNALRERVAGGRTQIARPVAILVTKWDLIEPGPITEASEAHAGAFLESVHPELTSGLGTLCENLRIFPVSATGPLVAGQPPTPLRPTNLGEPIAWLVETAERVMLERALAFVEQNRSRLFRRDPGDARRRTYQEIAIERLEHFLDDVPHGPLANEARARIEELRDPPWASSRLAAAPASRRLSSSSWRSRRWVVAITGIIARRTTCLMKPRRTSRDEGRSSLV